MKRFFLGVVLVAIVCVNTPAGAVYPGLVKTRAELKKLTVPDGALVKIAGIVFPGDGGAGYWKYSCSSTEAANDMYAIVPESGKGRWLLMPRNNSVTTHQLGIFGDGRTDCTPALNAANAYTASKRYRLWFNAGVYIIDPAKGGIVMVNNMNWNAGNRNSTRIVSRLYNTMNRSMIMYYSTKDTLHNVRINNIFFDNGQRFANHAFALSNPIPDTTSHLINITLADSIYITHCGFKGSTWSAIYFYNTSRSHFDDNFIDSIGRMFISTVYCRNNKDIWIVGNRGSFFGMRDHYDAATGKTRFGDDFIEMGGERIHILRNKVRNGAKTRWAWLETALVGEGSEIAYNEMDGNGMNALGFSIGGDCCSSANQVPVVNLKIHDNIQRNMDMDKHTRADSVFAGGSWVSKFFNSNLVEIGVVNGCYFYNNTWCNVHFTAGNFERNISFINETIHNDSSNTQTESGQAILFNWGVSNLSGGDSCINTVIRNCRIDAKDGVLFRLNAHGPIIAGFSITNNNFKWKGSFILGEIYKTAAGYPIGIAVEGNVFAGHCRPAFYADAAPEPTTISVRRNNWTKTNMDGPAKSIIYFKAGAYPKFDFAGSVFARRGYRK